MLQNFRELHFVNPCRKRPKLPLQTLEAGLVHLYLRAAAQRGVGSILPALPTGKRVVISIKTLVVLIKPTLDFRTFCDQKDET